MIEVSPEEKESKKYLGNLSYPKKMPPEVRKAFFIYYAQRCRNKVNYSCREFIFWWLENIAKKEWVDPTTGRIDHDLGYSFDNIEMQERRDNSIERNSRLGNPGKSNRPVRSTDTTNGIVIDFPTMAFAQMWHGVCRKTIYNHCIGRTKQHFRFGGGTKNNHKTVVFSWI